MTEFVGFLLISISIYGDVDYKLVQSVRGCAYHAQITKSLHPQIRYVSCEMLTRWLEV